jgi:hypothetical protein
MHRQPPAPTHEETQFEMICRLARELDIAGLKKMEARDVLFLSESQNDCTPIQLLAREGYDDAVKLLINHFRDDAGGAVRGYAEAGLRHKVEALLQCKSYEDFDNVREFLGYRNNLPYIYRGWEQAVAGYVHAGLHDLVGEIVQAHPEAIDAAVTEYVRMKNWDRVEAMLLLGGKLDHHDLPATSFDDDALLQRLMALVAGENTRRALLGLTNPWVTDDEPAFLHSLKKAARIHRLIKEYHLNYRQAFSLHEFQEKGHLQGLRTWLLEGLQITEKRRVNTAKDDDETSVSPLPLVPKDIYIKITSHLLGLTLADARIVLIAARAQLFASVAKHNAEKLVHGFFSPAKYITEQAKIIDAYDPQIKRLKN